jgi:hypothetical protein
MYIIRNNTEGKVIIGDLNLTLTHGEEKDLDLLFSRSTIAGSHNLRSAISPSKAKRPAVVVVKDSPDIVISVAPQPIATPLPTVDQDALEAMEMRIREQMAEQMKKLMEKDKTATTDDLAAKMDLILKALASGQTTAAKPSVAEEEIDDEKMIDIHKRTIERLTRNSKASIQSSQSESKDTGVNDKAEELEGLI